MRLAVIPARGGSKRIPKKNIKDFAGKPMIGYAIEAAFSAGVFDRIIVSTDSQSIADISIELGAEVPFMRPPSLADDFTPTVPVVAHAISTLSDMGWSADLACCIYPGVPLLDPKNISSALNLLESGHQDYVFPVASFPSPIQRALKREEDGVTMPFHPEHVLTRTQDLTPAYFDSGQFYWGRSEAWLSDKNIHLNAATIVLPESSVVDIDTPDDWSRAEILFKLYNVS